jgi:serine phosphatase RsbU (regulator of sigma subunit)
VDRDEYQQFDERLAVGDMVLSYSNVLTECRGASGRILGVEGLLRRVRQLDPQQPAELVSSLIGRIRAEHAGNFATDDATAILCRATDTKVAWRDNLLAPFRLLRSAGDRTRIR